MNQPPAAVERNNDGDSSENRHVRAFSNPRTRRIVRYLVDHAPTAVELSTLVEVIQREEGRRRAEDERRIAVDLHHCRLPQLADLRIIEYDARTQTVVYRPSRVEEHVHRAVVKPTR